MERMGCVDIKALPLQLLLRSHEDWRGKPVVVVDRDKPNGVILWANRQAYALRIFPGMRYAAGLALAGDLRGGCVAADGIARAVGELTQQLWCFSPSIEPAADEPGVFWLDASGLSNVYPSLRGWAAAICEELRDQKLFAVAAVGFSRFGSYAAAKAGDRNIVFDSPEAEQGHTRRIPIERLRLNPALRDTLLKLGVETVGQFIDLSGAGIRARFGAEAAALHALARGAGWSPLQPQKLWEPIVHTADFDWPESKTGRVLVRLGAMLHDALGDLAERNEALKAVVVTLHLDDGQEQRERIAPNEPTRKAQQILHLIQLRIESIALSAGVSRVTLHAEGVSIVEGQLEMFREARQSFEDAARAFATLRAEFGNDAVVCAELHEGHLPEAQYQWKPMSTLRAPKPNSNAAPCLIRRIYTPPIELPPRERHEPDGWLIAGIKEGPVEEVLGPYYVSGGWWRREIARAYHYVRTRSGRWFWIYRDEVRRRWYLHGEVQ